MAREWPNSNRVRFNSFPSLAYIMNPNRTTAKLFDILFPSFADISEALNMNISQREFPVFRKNGKKCRDHIPIQNIGTKTMHRTSRCILLGPSMPYEPTEGAVPIKSGFTLKLKIF